MNGITWQERARATLKSHLESCKKDSNWTISKTAEKLRRSYGSVNEDIFVADYMRTFKSMEEMETFGEALEFARKRKKEIKLQIQPPAGR